MGVYIKGMDRVSDCMYCIFYSHGYCNAKHSRCNSEFGIDADCPLVEVTEPHGRLIDADVLTKKYQEHHDFFTNAWGGFKNMPINDKARCDELSNCMADILNTSTVIEAEGE